MTLPTHPQASTYLLSPGQILIVCHSRHAEVIVSSLTLSLCRCFPAWAVSKSAVKQPSKPDVWWRVPPKPWMEMTLPKSLQNWTFWLTSSTFLWRNIPILGVIQTHVLNSPITHIPYIPHIWYIISPWPHSFTPLFDIRDAVETVWTKQLGKWEKVYLIHIVWNYTQKYSKTSRLM